MVLDSRHASTARLAIHDHRQIEEAAADREQVWCADITYITCIQ
jgi:hypothetical protein